MNSKNAAVLGDAFAPDADYYKVLGVPLRATIEQIKAGYRRRALRYHPDKVQQANAAGSRSGGEGALDPDSRADAQSGRVGSTPSALSAKIATDTEEMFKRCSEAYATLSNADKRAAYDMRVYLLRGYSELLGGLVEDVLGRPLQRKRRGSDHHQVVMISLEEAFRGVEVRVEVHSDVFCEICSGRGSTPEQRCRCESCNAKGEMPRQGLLSLPRPCPACGGRGERPSQPCGACTGVGMVERRNTVTVNVPAGVDDGHRIRLLGRGGPGCNGGAPGDLHVVIRLQPHELFKREGRDLTVDAPVDYMTLTLGGTVVVPTLVSSVRLEIPAGTQSGVRFRVREHGLPALQDRRRGDLIVRVWIEVPVGLGDDAARQLRAFYDHCCEFPATHPHLCAWRERLLDKPK